MWWTRAALRELADIRRDVFEMRVELHSTQRSMVEELRLIRGYLRRLAVQPQFGEILLECEEMDMLKYRLGLAPVTSDTAQQRLTINVDGVDRDIMSLAKDTAEVEFSVPQDSTVVLTLVYLDDVGNESAPATRRFVALDTIAPEAPEGFGTLTLVDEVEVKGPDTEAVAEVPAEELPAGDAQDAANGSPVADQTTENE